MSGVPDATLALLAIVLLGAVAGCLSSLLSGAWLKAAAFGVAAIVLIMGLSELYGVTP